MSTGNPELHDIWSRRTNIKGVLSAKRPGKMNDKYYLIVSGVIFGLITVGQLARLVYQIPVQIGPMNVPIWPSFIGVTLALVLCIWSFSLLRAGRQQ